MLFSLLPLYYIVVPIRELVNILFSTLTTTVQSLQMACLPSTRNMDVDTDIIRRRSTSSSKVSSRESLIDSKASSMAYHKRIEIMNNLLNNDIWEPINSSQLSYALNKEEAGKGKMVSKVTDNSLQ